MNPSLLHLSPPSDFPIHVKRCKTDFSIFLKCSFLDPMREKHTSACNLYKRKCFLRF